MRGERYQNLIATLLIVLALASVSLVVNLSGLWWLWAPLLASLATLAAVFLRAVDVPVGGLARPTVAGGLARTREGRGACVARGRPVDDPPYGPRSVRGAAESLHRFLVDHGDRGIHRVDCAARRPVPRPERVQSAHGALGS